MIDLGRAKRRPFLAGLTFLVGSVVSVSVLGQAAEVPDLSEYLGLALQAVVGLVGLLGPTLLMLRSVMGSREGLMRNETNERLSALEARVAQLETKE